MISYLEQGAERLCPATGIRPDSLSFPTRNQGLFTAENGRRDNLMRNRGCKGRGSPRVSGGGPQPDAAVGTGVHRNPEDISNFHAFFCHLTE